MLYISLDTVYCTDIFRTRERTQKHRSPRKRHGNTQVFNYIRPGKNNETYSIDT